MAKKLKLNALKIQSFTTSLTSDEQNDAKGGLSVYSNCEACSDVCQSEEYWCTAIPVNC